MVNVNIYVNEPLTFGSISRGDAFIRRNEKGCQVFVRLVEDVEKYDRETGTWDIEYNAVSFEGKLEYFDSNEKVIPAKANVTVHPATVSSI